MKSAPIQKLGNDESVSALSEGQAIAASTRPGLTFSHRSLGSEFPGLERLNQEESPKHRRRPQIRAWWRNLRNGQGLFETRDLVTIGLFAGAAKASTLMLALVGGGMNPLTMILKSIVFSSLWVVLLTKVPKFGALTLANTVAACLGFFLLGQAVISLPSLILATLVVEILIRAIGGYKNLLTRVALAVALSESFMRLVNLFFAYLTAREQPGLMVMVIIISALSYFGILLGLLGGVKMVEELRHAGLIQT